MQEMQTIVTLLTVIVTLLSLVTMTLLGVIIALLVKLREVAKKVDDVTSNIVRVTEWFSPTKIISSIADLFSKK